VNAQVMELSRQLPSPAATEALAALGFETLFVRRQRGEETELRRFEETWREDPAARVRLPPLGETRSVRAYRLVPQEPVEMDFRRLSPGVDGEAGEVLIPGGRLELPIANRDASTFRHPDPLAPSELLLRWSDRGGRVVHEEVLRALLPIALGPGGEMPFGIDATTPAEPGAYRVTLARVDEPDHLLARRRVHVRSLEEGLSAAQIAYRVHRDFAAKVLPQDVARLVPPVDRIDVRLAPDVTSADDLRGRGRVAVHFVDSERTPYTVLADVDAEPSELAGRASLRLPLPDRSGPIVILITPVDDPRTLLAGQIVFVDVPDAER
jgi:hypothetical protein